MDDYTREMMDLKTLVTRTLEKKGVLAKIRVCFPSPHFLFLLHQSSGFRLRHFLGVEGSDPPPLCCRLSACYLLPSPDVCRG
ncbi:hypothetical protein MLD38_011200 [Melastoma candidum]|uniref:Uncharacterized protein n=1 Tax=Melastoma candidum TaxID=119954 RepID=A0ACB9R420_9MYRT|nr:hypothetical protein MLD38_011200 [Melastoma candidum]